MIRNILSRFVCFLLGHLVVEREAVWYQQRSLLPTEVDAVCIRCWRHRITFKADLFASIFSESPVMKKLKGNQ